MNEQEALAGAIYSVFLLEETGPYSGPIEIRCEIEDMPFVVEFFKNKGVAEDRYKLISLE